MSNWLAGRLTERLGDMEQITLTRVRAVADPTAVDDPSYTLGLADAVRLGLSYAILGIEECRGSPPSVPVGLLEQARLAARLRVRLDTVLRRYLAGYTVLSDFVIAELASRDDLDQSNLQGVMKLQAVLFDRLIDVVSGEYVGESTIGHRGVEARRAEQVRRLLAGEFVDADALGYSLSGWHIGFVVAVPGARAALLELGREMGRRLLVVEASTDAAWGWLGGQTAVSADEVLRRVKRMLPEEAVVGVGEPGPGIQGWRLTHRQAAAACGIAKIGAQSQLCYAGAALVSTAIGDDLLTASLRDMYIVPLEQGKDGGELLRRTLMAYFRAGQNTAAAAAALGVSRQTTAARLRTAEERIGRPLDACRAELEVALHLVDCELLKVRSESRRP